ncbi:unnamed protein product [Calicophoron daubneyi]|uniref:C-type lectin domain-containing protein n=1 Tax=Calicophoron daubneyi TaxID=300641 RepID=A0AAV2T8E2_CALDB
MGVPVISLLFLSFLQHISCVFADQKYTNLCLSPGLCISISDFKSNFLAAHEECKKLNKSLLTIHRKEEQRLVGKKLKELFGEEKLFWFGLYFTNDNYQWISGPDILPNAYFSSRKPEDTNLAGSCFTIHGSDELYTWAAQGCDSKLPFICGTQTLGAVQKSQDLLGYRQCPQNYNLIDGKCFMPKLSIKDALSWNNASKACSQSVSGGTLASITSVAHQDYISLLVARSPGPAWIGMHLVADEHVWERKGPVSFTNWFGGQDWPRSKPVCTMVHQRPRHLGQWEDVSCDTKLGYICEAPAAVTQSPSSAEGDPVLKRGLCENGFYEHRGRCYRLLSDETSQNTSIKSVSNSGGCSTRLSPHSSEDWAFMRLLLSRQSTFSLSWIGVTFVLNTSTSPRMRFITEDGLPLLMIYSVDFNQLPLPDSNISEIRQCIALSRTKSAAVWVNCSTKLPSICGHALPEYGLHSNPAISCPPGWTRLNTKCYSSISNSQLTWSEAEAFCQQLNNQSHLPSLHTPAEQQFLTNILFHQRAWLGLRVKLQSGSRRVKQFHWSDDTPVDYLSFRIGEPSFSLNNGAVEECVVLQEKTHDWNDINCYDRHNFVCQLSLVNSTATPPQPDPANSVHEECSTTLSPNICIELHTRPAEFWSAQNECRARNKTLVTIVSKEHHLYIMSAIRKMSGGSPLKAYIGLYSIDKLLRWASGYQAFPATFWHGKTPDTDAQCVYINSGLSDPGTWEFGSCESALPFICAHKIDVPESKQIDDALYRCPDGYIRIGDGCFMMKAEPTDKLSWPEATQACAKTAPNARLASIPSLHEHDGLTALLALHSLPVWIGLYLTDYAHSWRSNVSVTFTNWLEGEPDGRGTRCTMMRNEFDKLGKWSDEDCDRQMGYICEADPVRAAGSVKTDMTDVLKKGRCVDGYYEYRNQCFTLYSDSKDLNRSSVDLHDEVSGRCLRLTHLLGVDCNTRKDLWGTKSCPVPATPHTLADAAFMRLLIHNFGLENTEAWIGLKLLSTVDLNQLLSEDGSLLGASSFVNFEPIMQGSGVLNSTSPLHSCLVASTLDTQLKVVNCSDKGYPIVCGYSLDDHTLHPNRTLHNARCPKGWRALGENCYRSAPLDLRKSWREAETACHNMAISIPGFTGHLPSIHTLEEQHLLTELIPSSSIWIGLRALYTFGARTMLRFPIRKPHHSVQLVWSDQSPMDYFAFPANATDVIRPYTPELCFVLSEHKRELQPTYCRQPRSYVCQLTPSKNDKPTLEGLPRLTDNKPSKNPCSDGEFSLPGLSNGACYRVVRSNADWVSAEGVCRNLDPAAHLASVHSQHEFDELSKSLASQLPKPTQLWFGLYESNFAYAWSDRSSVNYISLTADLSKDNRHLSQDCFVLAQVTGPSPGQNPCLWNAVDCNSTQPAFVCQRYASGLLNNSGAPSDRLTTNSSTWRPLLCPPGFRQYGDRCFSVVTEPLPWSEADRKCSRILKEYPGFSGSLVRIDSSHTQDFVASLLDGLAPGQSSAWIGLHRDFSERIPNMQWSDSGEMRYLRSVYRASQEPIFKVQAVQSPADREPHIQLCTALFRSTDPRLNGLWLQWSCNEVTHLPSVCQAVPISSSVISEAKPVKSWSKDCPPNFYLGTTGFSSGPSRPVCYHLLSRTERYNWKEADERCKNLSTRDYEVNLISVASVFEASFIRSWLLLPESLGGAGLALNEPVWTALQLPHNSYHGWTWNTTTPEPVRFTDWLIPPSSPSGCFLFYSSPYMRHSEFESTGLGSLQQASSCGMPYYAVCQAMASRSTHSTGSLGLSTSGSHESERPNCVTVDAGGTSESLPSGILTNLSVSSSGKSCIRWDLVPPKDITEFHLRADWFRHRLSAARVVGGDGTLSYAENYCSLLYDPGTAKTLYGCYVNASSPEFESCKLVPCDNAAVVVPHAVSHTTVIVLMVFVVLGVFLLGFGLWRGYAPLRAGYRRHTAPNKFDTATGRMRRSSVQYVAPDSVNGIGAQVSTSGDRHREQQHPLTKSDSEYDRTDFLPLKTSDQPKTNAEPLNPAGATPGLSLSAPLGSVAFYNPMYSRLNNTMVDDDYDPEANM